MVGTEDLELAGEVVQDAAAYLGLTDLESTAHFPDHMQDFQAVLAKASSLHYQLLYLLLDLEISPMPCCSLMQIIRNCGKNLPVFYLFTCIQA